MKLRLSKSNKINNLGG